jgi:HAD superfamily hydrolase (TIGR01549 family)
MVKVIIFDFWGTLIENGVQPSPSKQVLHYLRLRVPFSGFIGTFEQAFMTKQHNSLREGFDEVTRAFDKHIPDFVYDKLVGMWNKFSILSHPFEDTLPALDDLSKDYKLVILTNTDNFSFHQVLDKYELEKYFAKVYLSCDTGLLKSDVGSYQQILADLDVDATDCLMVGDSPQSDLESAKAAGIPAVLIDRREWAENIPKVKSLTELREYIATLENVE